MERQEGDEVVYAWSHSAYYAFQEVISDPVRSSSWGFYTAEGLLHARQERQERELGIALAAELNMEAEREDASLR